MPKINSEQIATLIDLFERMRKLLISIIPCEVCKGEGDIHRELAYPEICPECKGVGVNFDDSED
ncbi:hypothetical protein EBZ39_02310 [bacterium]|nr:hypothetical protein [bacterium]